MILIIGQTHDDILYFENIMHNKENEELFNTIPLITGTIYNQDVCLAYNVYSNYISSLIITHLIRSKFVIFVVSVGKAKTYFDDLQVGDVVLSNSITLGDVDFTNENNCKLGQIPFLSEKYLTQSYLSQIFTQSFNKVLYKEPFKADFISLNKHIKDVHQLTELIANNFVLGLEKETVFDTESGGAAVACHLADVPYISIKVIESKIGEDTSLDNYLKVLEKYIEVGKGVSIAISEIGRKDFIK